MSAIMFEAARIHFLYKWRFRSRHRRRRRRRRRCLSSLLYV